MANITKHKKVSAVADVADTSLVRPSDWNDEHVFAGGDTLQYLMWSAGASDKVAFDNIWARLPYIDITKPPYSADNTGVADATSAFQAAIAAGGVICLPPGDYKITATLTITNAVHIFGIGAGPGGAISGPDLRYKGAVINHHFNGTLFDIPGILNNVIGPVGTTLENFIIRQTYGNASANAGTAIRIVGTSSNFRATWTKVRNVNIESDTGVTDDWTYGIYIDGSAITTGGIGSRDHFFENMRIITGPTTLAGVYALSPTNGQYKSIIINGTGNPDFILTGGSATRASLIKCWAIAATGAIETDYAEGVQFYGCSCNDLTISANSSDVQYYGTISHTPTITTGAVGCFVHTPGQMYYTGDNGRVFRFIALDGFQTRVAIDTAAGVSGYLTFKDAGSEYWLMGKAGTDNSWFFNHGTLGNIWTVGTTGAFVHRKGFGQTAGTPTFVDPVVMNLNLGNVFIITASSNINFTISNPTNPIINQMFTIRIMNTSGGALGTATFDTNYKLQGAWVQPADTKNRSITFMMDVNGTKAYEISRVTADVDN